MVAEHGDELGIFGKVEPIFELAEGEHTPFQIDSVLNNQMPKLLADDSIINKIDEEIKESTSSQANRESKAKNLKQKIDD